MRKTVQRFPLLILLLQHCRLDLKDKKKMDIYIKPDAMKNLYAYLLYIEGYGFMVFNATFNNISVTNVYRGGQLYWWGNPEYTEKTTSLSQVTDKLYRILLYRHERGSNSQLMW
jgi:hypothetical protein